MTRATRGSAPNRGKASDPRVGSARRERWQTLICRAHDNPDEWAGRPAGHAPPPPRHMDIIWIVATLLMATNEEERHWATPTPTPNL